jgi:hypothetical protein
MPKILVTEACLIDLKDDQGGQHYGLGSTPTVPKDIAADLVKANRALYADKADDFDKAGRNTATKELLKAADAAAKAAAAVEASPSA